MPIAPSYDPNCQNELCWERTETKKSKTEFKIQALTNNGKMSVDHDTIDSLLPVFVFWLQNSVCLAQFLPNPSGKFAQFQKVNSRHKHFALSRDWCSCKCAKIVKSTNIPSKVFCSGSHGPNTQVMAFTRPALFFLPECEHTTHSEEGLKVILHNFGCLFFFLNNKIDA